MPTWTFLLCDGGSKQRASSDLLISLARKLAAGTGRRVEAVSLLHSSGEDRPTLGTYLEQALLEGWQHFALLPIFLGPSRALTRKLPELVRELMGKHSALRVEIGGPLYLPEEDPGLLEAVLREGICLALGQCSEDSSGQAPRVILLDHGSPSREVTAVRDQLAARLQSCIGPAGEGMVSEVCPASMERRPGVDYAFADPLLVDFLEDPALWERTLILSMLFVAPGRHAGMGGDVDRILSTARDRAPGLRIVRTPLLGELAGFRELLRRRLEDLASRLPSRPLSPL
jgi:sirohydrochlorin ferrochelatase